PHRAPGRRRQPPGHPAHGRPAGAGRAQLGQAFPARLLGFSLRVHLMMFGSCRIDAPKDRPPRLALHFDKGSLYFYACSVRFIEGPLAAACDWRADVMSPDWDPALARRKLRSAPEALACD